MSRISRRSILSHAGAWCIVSGTLGRSEIANAASVRVPLRVVLDLTSGRRIFDEVDGQDMGDYVAPSGTFVQQCRRVKDSETPFTVMFRPDRASDRAEVVIEFGTLWSDSSPYQEGPYTATIMRGDTPLAKINVPEHYWLSRWRWQSAPRPILRTPDHLIRSGKVPPYGIDSHLPIELASDPKWARMQYSVMGLAGLHRVYAYNRRASRDWAINRASSAVAHHR